jgi:hypothetical protein
VVWWLEAQRTRKVEPPLSYKPSATLKAGSVRP